MYKEGDLIPNVGVVEANHCGLPWLAGQNGLFCGVVQSGNNLCDALSGVVLNTEEVKQRLNDTKYDYEDKMSNCEEWRKINQPYGPYYYKYKWNPLEAWYYRLRCHLDDLWEKWERKKQRWDK